MTTLGIIMTVVALLCGVFIGWFIMRLSLKYRAQNIIKEAEAEAEVIKKDKILQAKEKFLQIKTEHEKQAAARNNKLLVAENKINDKARTPREITYALKRGKNMETF